MNRLLLCLGNYAQKPFFIERAYINVYCAEELCYCLIHNANLPDLEILNERLADWLKTECGLKELADSLHKALADDCTVGEYVGIILEYVGYGNIVDINRIKDSLENSSGQNVYEKRKARADYFGESKKYMLAIKNYDSLLEELPEQEQEIKAAALHNRGVIYAELFQFRHAAENFIQSYECSGNEASYIGYLAASRMFMEETEYVDFIARQTMDYGLSLRVEQLMEEAVKQFEKTALRLCKKGDNSVSYYEEMERLTKEIKEQYRQNLAE